MSRGFNSLDCYYCPHGSSEFILRLGRIRWLSESEILVGGSCRKSARGRIPTLLSHVFDLPHGLTEKALSAARNIKFIPAMKDGKYVSMYIQLEYNFNLY
jgi:hypothetical protein